MEEKKLTLDLLALRLGRDIVDYILNWMRGNHAEEADFHRYRMKLLFSLADETTSAGKIIALTKKTAPDLVFDVREYVSDKVLGESIARYIFSKIMLRLNEKYKKILEFEAEKIGAEINVLNQKMAGLKVKIGQH